MTDDSKIADTFNTFCNIVKPLNIEQNKKIICDASDGKDHKKVLKHPSILRSKNSLDNSNAFPFRLIDSSAIEKEINPKATKLYTSQDKKVEGWLIPFHH